MSHEEQTDHVEKKLKRLEELKSLEFGSKTAKSIWLERLAYQVDFFDKLKVQLKYGESVKGV